MRRRNPHTLTDAAPIAGLFIHDEAAPLAVIESCGKHIYGKALQIVLEPGLTEELAQDTLLVLWWAPERALNLYARESSHPRSRKKKWTAERSTGPTRGQPSPMHKRALTDLWGN